jgi:hypothetical protein
LDELEGGVRPDGVGAFNSLSEQVSRNACSSVFHGEGSTIVEQIDPLSIENNVSDGIAGRGPVLMKSKPLSHGMTVFVKRKCSFLIGTLSISFHIMTRFYRVPMSIIL